MRKNAFTSTDDEIPPDPIDKLYDELQVIEKNLHELESERLPIDFERDANENRFLAFHREEDFEAWKKARQRCLEIDQRAHALRNRTRSIEWEVHNIKRDRDRTYASMMTYIAQLQGSLDTITKQWTGLSAEATSLIEKMR